MNASQPPILSRSAVWAVRRHFFNNVMMFLNYYDWSLTFGEGSCSYCYIRDKRIDIGIDYKGDLRQIILHEIAHINTAKYCNQKHNHQFWKHLQYLTVHFLRKELDESQVFHKKWGSEGIYALCYQNGV